MATTTRLPNDKRESTPLLSFSSTGRRGGDTFSSSDGSTAAVARQQRVDQHSAPNDSNRDVNHYNGRLLLLTVAFLYGSLNVTLRWIYDLPGPPTASALSCVRGWLAALSFGPPLLYLQFQNRDVLSTNASTTTTSAPSILRNESSTNNAVMSTFKHPTLLFWRVATELALLNFGAQALLTLGLQTTASARASFFTQTSVLWTPLLSRLLGDVISHRVWISCAVALSGLLLLTTTSSSASNSSSSNTTLQTHDDDDDFHYYASDHHHSSKLPLLFALSWGDVLCLVGALCWSAYLYRLSSIEHLALAEIPLQAAKTLILGVLYTIWVMVEAMMLLHDNESTDAVSMWSLVVNGFWPGVANPMAWLLLWISAVGPGTLADVLQQMGQAHISASESNILLSLEPVFAALLGFVLLHESNTWVEVGGGTLIVAASLISTAPSPSIVDSGEAALRDEALSSEEEREDIHRTHRIQHL